MSKTHLAFKNKKKYYVAVWNKIEMITDPKVLKDRLEIIGQKVIEGTFPFF
ncbi:MAG: hypothetical protein RLZZ546_1598 [Bacteroidota bacterium]|jgi:hypothetical protein